MNHPETGTRHVLVIEDDRALRTALAQTLELADMAVIQAASYIEAKDHMSATFPGVILSDIRMPGKDGFDVLSHARRLDPDLPVILLTGESDVPTALRAMSDGAYDYLEKPCDPDHLAEVLIRAQDHRALVLRTRRIERQLQKSDAAATNFPGPSEITETLRRNLRRAAGLPIHLHLFGPAGAGKRLAAHTIHALSDDRPSFATLTLKGAPDEAVATLEAPAPRATLSLKNLDCATPRQQDDLLRLIERRPDLRLITSAPAPLADLRARGLSEDLYFALNLMEIELPGLDRRKGDLAVLFEALVRQAVRNLNQDMPPIPDSVYAQVMARDWPDNLPELRNFAHSVVLGINATTTGPSMMTLAEQMDAFEKAVLAETLRRSGGKAARAAAVLGLPRKTFYDKLARHGLKPRSFRSDGL
ncbi:sigma-54-dependent transcriptional regulator [Oceaniglobus trochenteri]|uniref:sigma-54-dependent transcriptional regulator n=1 Tax=Oceaniglobus trochenteri TaxID=2763260 RepID=UPI001CFF5E73|nr:response regulator [Oceaniglobus trochenteri]